MKLKDLEDKTLVQTEYDIYKTCIKLVFDDGTRLLINTGSTGSHFDRWMTVEYEIIPDENKPEVTPND